MTFILAWMAIPPMQGQKANQEVVKNIYDALQNNSSTSKDIVAMIPTLKWDEVRKPKGANEKYSIALSGIIKKEWGDVVFENLRFQTPEKNMVFVTGIVMGRQPTECEFISYQFQHTWFLKEGEIINFKE
ncbi:MAG TPA: hypothetical protein VLN46_05365 [Gillisia sp.]|nr:hypothetical protein [Gillisia sp.]